MDAKSTLSMWMKSWKKIKKEGKEVTIDLKEEVEVEIGRKDKTQEEITEEEAMISMTEEEVMVEIGEE